jgi:hypothetical protein
MRYLFLLLATLIALPLWPTQTQAASIYMRYFESVDSDLSQDRFRIVSFTAFEGEQLTLAAHGLESDVRLGFTLLDPQGMTLAENLNPEGLPVTVLQLEAPSTGIYSLLLIRLSERGGLARLMLFEGDPIEADYSVLDELDPFLPSTAYMIEAPTTDEVKVAVSVVQDALLEAQISLYASVGTDQTPPTLDQRVTPVTVREWQTESPTEAEFYTLNVRLYPEAPPTSHKLTAHLSQMAQTGDVVQVRLDVGAGQPTPAQVNRARCSALSPSRTSVFDQADAASTLLGTLAPNQLVEILGVNGNFILVETPASLRGIGWVRESALRLQVRLDDPACSRVLTLTDQTSPPPQEETIQVLNQVVTVIAQSAFEVPITEPEIFFEELLPDEDDDSYEDSGEDQSSDEECYCEEDTSSDDSGAGDDSGAVDDSSDDGSDDSGGDD